MSLEARVGAFLLIGLVILAGFLFKLGGITLARQYAVNVTFHDVSGLPDKSVVKLAGVEVGKVDSIDLSGDKVVVHLRINEGVQLYKDDTFSIGATSVIGSKYLEIDQGHPSSGILAPGSTVAGEESVPLEREMADALKNVQGVLDELHTDLAPGGALMGSLTASMQNMRDLTANMSDLIADVKPELEASLKRSDQITVKLDQLLGRTNQLMANLNSSSGTVGALMTDTEMKADVKETVANMKDASQSAKNVLGAFGRYHVYWNFTARNEPAANDTKGDAGLYIVPRDGRYYYLGGEDLGNGSSKNIPRGVDYETPNTIDAQLGFYGTWWNVFGGVIKSSFGLGTRVNPFPGVPVLNNFDLFAEAENFGRNQYIDGRLFDTPEFDAGLEYKIIKYITVGARVQDIDSSVPRYETTVNLAFEDKDVAYLFGLVTFAEAGVKSSTTGTTSSSGPP